MKFLIFILITTTGLGVSASECDFYREKSAAMQCPSSGYLIGFGYKYCRYFVDHADEFSSEGQATLQKIRFCLIDSLKRPLVALTCDNIKDLAMQNHIDCYVNNGFCSLDLFDRLQVYWLLKDRLQDTSFLAAGEEIRRQCHFLFLGTTQKQ
jgi:hypothetical protein